MFNTLPRVIAGLIIVLGLTSTAYAEGFTTGQKVLIKAACATETSVQQMAAADAKSQQQAEMVFQYFQSRGECRIFRKYQKAIVVGVPLEYKDHAGDVIQVIKIAPPDKTDIGPFGWVLLAKSVADEMRKHIENKISL